MREPPDRDLRRRLRFAHDLLDETDEIALGAWGAELQVNMKPDRTLVSQADTDIELRMRERIATAYPAEAFLGEELGGAVSPAAEARWIVDPIDATHNFVRGIGVFATLLAFERGGNMELGLASAPALGQRWFAARGAGAFVRGMRGEHPIRVSAISRLEEAHVLYGSLGGLDEDRDARLGAVARSAWRNRGFGDFWGHVLVAQGSAEVMVESDLKPWDLAAPGIILAEAGGRLTDFTGRSTWWGPEAVSTNGLLHDLILARLAG